MTQRDAHRSLFVASRLLCMLCLAVCISGQAQEDAITTPAEPLPVPAANPLKTRDELQIAYQKEYALLEVQVRELQQMLTEFSAAARHREAEREAQIDRAEGETIDLQSRADRVNDLLTEAERQIASIEDSRSTLESTFGQAGATLEPFDIAALRSDDYLTADSDAKLDLLFGHTLALLRESGKVDRQPGRFFLVNGTEVEGTLIRVGQVAAYGVAGDAGGALAPAGDGRMKVWTASSPETALALAQGHGPGTLGVFLFESRQKAVEEKASRNLVALINSGGTIAWIIVGLGLLAALLVTLRIAFLRNASASTGRVTNEVGQLVRQGRLEDALRACKQLKGSTARVVASAIRNLNRDREHVEDIVSEQILHESTHLNRFGAFIIVIAAVSPLLGLLGTVTGMISTFDIITEFGTGDPKLLSSGISIALVTTEVGLIVAIPALIFGNLLSGWAEAIKDDMEKAALHVMNLYKDKPSAAGVTG